MNVPGSAAYTVHDSGRQMTLDCIARLVPGDVDLAGFRSQLLVNLDPGRTWGKYFAASSQSVFLTKQRGHVFESVNGNLYRIVK